ncbi:MAG: N-6 DNA methylase, partial [Balneolaceae bacterium]
MALFQHSVLNTYLSGIDKQKVDGAWESFKDHFHDSEIQGNIRNSKEEEYQAGFLRDLFAKVLGYTIYPANGYNLRIEHKDEKGTKKADAALLKDDKVTAVIELKGTDTTDLDKVESQAFGYKNYHRHAEYVIISNFEKLRFYIDNAVEHIEFNLFELTEDEFKVLWLCLEQSNLSKGLPKKIKEASLTENEEVTKKLYADYSSFKDDIFKSIVEHNPDYDKLRLFKKTQKLLDRFLFIFFAEDQQLLPANSIKLIIQEWQQLRDLDEYRPLYDRFKKYFGYLNTGRNTPGKEEIFPYNGGLFTPDEVLDNITIDDELLYKHTLQLSKYDFASEVDVNILGHIFEHSLNEIEEINAELKGEEVDASKTRRKKDGVYYTPKYITKYIVENTVGKLCDEKKAELDIDDEEYRPNRHTKTKKPLLSKLDTYRQWMLELSICDPACGSGAFLNQALEYLIDEHSYIDELQAKLLGESIVLPDIENQILENNLFGVDINEESVEIAKLSLWLRTAQKGRKLTSLNNHIKCGNSLIDDPEVAGDKAFNWEEEFPEVFRQKEKQAYHVTWVTHNARTSQRMIDYKVKKGEPFWLNEDLEVFITREIAKIVKEDDLNVLAYNICEDHVHMLLVCEPDELPNIVRKLKGRSSQKLKEHLGVPKEEKFHLWAQKFDRKPVEDEEGLEAVRNYIIRNREKHNLPPNKGLQPLVAEAMSCTIEHAFRPETSGGFDVVIGNPPYVSANNMDYEDRNFFNDSDDYEHLKGKWDLYIPFTERALQIIKDGGRLSFIIPYGLLNQKFGESIREYILNECKIESIVDFHEVKIFADATVPTCIPTIKKAKVEEYEVEILKLKNGAIESAYSFDKEMFESAEQTMFRTEDLRQIRSITEKINNNSDGKLSDYLYISTGAEIHGKEQRTEEGELISGHSKFDVLFDDYKEGLKEYIEGSAIEKSKMGRYSYPKRDYWLNYVPDRMRSPKFIELFESEKIIIRGSSGKLGILATYDDRKLYTPHKITIGIKRSSLPDSKSKNENNDDVSLKYILGIINSKLIDFYYKSVFGGFIDVYPNNLKELPIVLSDQENDVVKKVDKILGAQKELFEVIDKFRNLLFSKFDIDKLSRKLQSWHDLTFKQFLKELKKKKVKLSLEEEAEWMEYFNRQKAQADELKSQIAQTDSEIDAMVYELYGLG